ncbi:MAG: HAMP domain-containing histidine kinase [Deltaproteobacteria bacterium]|nr:HAMP domain-containing histidine kinase [Deltaproteobacteria bacterium]
MNLRVRLAMALAAIGLITSLFVAIGVRGALVAEERNRFENRVASAVGDVRRAIDRRVAADRAALDRTCAADPIVDRALVAAKARADIEKLSPSDSELARLEVAAVQARAAVAAGVNALGAALGSEEVWIVDARDGFVLAAPKSSRAVVGTKDPRRLKLAMERGTAVRRGNAAALVSRCAREERGEAVVVATFRKLDRAFFDRIAEEVRGIRILETGDAPHRDEAVRSFTLPTVSFDDVEPGVPAAALELRVGVSGVALASAIARIDQVIVVATLISIAFGAFVGFAVARRLVSPLGALASEARKVAEGTAAPVEVRGRDEVAELAIAFNAMIEDLETTRRRLHAAERVAAWREAARRIAHEIKNPLAPIRASIETLRRLRAREDPAFDGYFDEATSTVLQEVRRVTSIVDEFSRYARIAPPRPAEVDPVEVARHVVGLFQNADASTGGEVGSAVSAINQANDPQPRLSLVASPSGGIRADREQLVQVLVNLVKNALEATRPKDGKPAGHVRVEVEPAGPEAVRFVVRDDGPGVDPAVLSRLFEPYASTKQGGTGLGLAIAQRIAVEHGGAIAYARGPKGGAVFRLILPRKGPKEPVSDSVTPRPNAAAT